MTPLRRPPRPLQGPGSRRQLPSGALAILLPLLAALAASARAESVPGLSHRTLPNGLEVIVLENPVVELVTVEVAVKAGAFVEPPELDGLSHLYEHMFFKANRVTPDQERFMARLRELGAVWNGSTTRERVNYYFTLPAKNLREGTVFLRDALLTPLLRRDELERERPVVLGEFDRNEATPEFHLRREVDRRLWHGHFSRKNTIGDRAVIASATREQMQFFRAHYYVPNNAALLFSGAVDAEEAFELAEELFGDWPRSADPHRRFPVPVHPPLARSSTLAVLQPVEAVTLQQSWHGPGLLADTPATFAADVLSFILEQPAARWRRNLVDSGLFDEIRLYYGSEVHTGAITVTGVTSAERLDGAHAALQRELAALGQPGYFTDDELAIAKRQLEYSELRSREQPSENVHTVSIWWATGGIGYYVDYVDNLRAVSREDIARYVSRYLQGKPSVTAVLLAESALPRATMLAGAEVVRPQTGTSATAIAAQGRSSGGTERFVVAGVPVLLRRVAGSPTVAMSAALRGGLGATAAADAGLERLVLEVARRQTERFPKQAMGRELARLGAEIRVSVAPEYTLFTLDAIAAQLADSAEVFLESLTRPLFTAEELELARQRQLTELRQLHDDPDGRAWRLAHQAHYGEHPFALADLGSAETLAEFDLEDLARKHAELVNRARLHLVVVGDVSREQLTALLAPALARLPEGTAAPAAPALPARDTPAVVVETREIPTVYLYGFFRGPGPRADDFPASYLAASMLSERLFEEIRTKRNLGYSASAWLFRRTPGAGGVNASTVDPTQVIAVMRSTIARLVAQPPTEGAVRDAASRLRTELLTRAQRPAQLAELLASYELAAGGWERFEEVLARIDEVTPTEVRQAIERHVRHVDFGVVGDATKVDRAALGSL